MCTKLSITLPPPVEGFNSSTYVFPKRPKLDQTSQRKVLHETWEVTETVKVSRRAASRQEELLAQKELGRVVCRETSLHSTLLGRCWHRKNKKDQGDCPWHVPKAGLAGSNERGRTSRPAQSHGRRGQDLKT